MLFNIITESGCMYRNVKVISSRGFARDKKDVKGALKYEKGITLLSPVYMNKYIENKNVYSIEEVEE
ncbi:TPA: hypothetical protein UL242_002394 [Clostridioides difficile]|uniref:Uncharacterized protein n=1 Tax=Clostridioides difficile TaxID=1496 RepID=A0AAN5VR83_CLODI|nr:hypothetical protein [Clostridioides difficile]MCC0672206.1 hypothetical protein [Clostridioides sp. ES-S-0145-01]MCC0681913.1 hypothetical protein [Clostridioides sp. ES-S-0005-03]MCC0709337.1 hypothetical protein [Clostridioides sp. ES-S-0190-01]UDN64108.1 hypothetical protein IC758_19730 [Clostridioides sp. ES-W-0016-02]EGT3643022.1 hypothetical protein [Clostridioides difficile]